MPRCPLSTSPLNAGLGEAAFTPPHSGCRTQSSSGVKDSFPFNSHPTPRRQQGRCSQSLVIGEGTES